MRNQPIDFSYIENYETSTRAKFFEAKINSAPSIEVAVLFGHVFLQDLLWDLLALRLLADTRPSRVPGFETLVGLTLAGSIFENEREALDFLNRARNEIGHRIERRTFDDAVKRFCELAWNMGDDENERPSRHAPFRWPPQEDQQLLVFRAAVMTIVMHLPTLMPPLGDLRG
jgi:hypothetical protein